MDRSLVAPIFIVLFLICFFIYMIESVLEDEVLRKAAWELERSESKLSKEEVKFLKNHIKELQSLKST